MDFKPPSYITKNRLGIYYFQLRIPKQFCQNHPHLPPLIRKSLGTRNRREALRLARKWVVLMENNDYLQDLSSMEKEADKHNDLFHSGKSLFEKLESLEAEGDHLEIEEFFTSLSPGQEIALRYVADENNDRIDAFSELLTNGEHIKALEFYEKTPRVFQKNLKSLRLQHKGQNRLVNTYRKFRCMLLDPGVLLGNCSCVALPPASMQSTVAPWQSTLPAISLQLATDRRR